jgi:hypothetical protein
MAHMEIIFCNILVTSPANLLDHSCFYSLAFSPIFFLCSQKWRQLQSFMIVVQVGFENQILNFMHNTITRIKTYSYIFKLKSTFANFCCSYITTSTAFRIQGRQQKYLFTFWWRMNSGKIDNIFWFNNHISSKLKIGKVQSIRRPKVYGL